MITTTLTGATGKAHQITVTPSKAFTVSGIDDTKRREITVRVRSALTDLRRDAAGDVALPQEADVSADLAVAFALVPDLAHGFDAAIGELSLTGEIRCVRGIIPRLEALRDAGVQRVIVPLSQLEAGSVAGIEIFGLRRLGEVPQPLFAWSWRAPEYPSLDEIQGLDEAKQALRAALAEGRDVLLVREPGMGATMLARRALGLLPALTDEERIEIARVWSAAGLPVSSALGRPFRAPHHTVSALGLAGGGRPTRPGEVTLAHGGVLFLDELCDFVPHALERLEDALDRSVSCDMPAHPRAVIATCTPQQFADARGIARRIMQRCVVITLPRYR
jgi:magnesium chelatase family protein